MDLVVGQGTFKLYDVARAMKRSVSFSLLLENWREFSHNLEVDDALLVDVRRELNTGLLKSQELPYEILKLWKAEKGDKATLKVLHSALVESGVQDIADVLFHTLFTLEYVRNIKFLWQKKVMTLEELFGKNAPPETDQNIHKQISKPLNNEPIQVLNAKTTPPEPPKYYIPRTLSHIDSTEVDPKMFLSDAAIANIFLFKDTTKSELVRLIKHSGRICTSGKQLDSVGVRFILLECDGDFERICRKTKEPVHLIQQSDGKFFWVKSSKNVGLIRAFLMEPVKSITEEEMATWITTNGSANVINVADFPGMGKSLLLASLANKITWDSQSIVMYIVLQDFVQEISKMDAKPLALETVAEYASASCSKVATSVLIEKMRRESCRSYLFHGGYDEVLQEKLDMVDALLKELQTLENVKVIITSRSHVRTQLEDTAPQLSHEILPFDETNQINFLIKYWETQLKINQSEMLLQFAKKCLSALQTELSDEDKEIAGIPLQCWLLAEVFYEDAKRACSLNKLSEDIIKPIPFFQMYKRLMDLKFRRAQEHEKCIYINAHVLEAIKLLFPEWLDIFTPILVGIEKIHETTLYSIGLFQKGPKGPQFLHRTFAEYLLAGFLVENLGRHEECRALLLRKILGRNGTTKERHISNYSAIEPHYSEIYFYKLNYPVIAYFIEMHLKVHGLPELLPLPPLRSKSPAVTKLHLEDICVAVSACATKNLETTFEYATSVLHYYRQRINRRLRNLHLNFKRLRNSIFKHLPHSIVINSNKMVMLEKVLEFTKREFKVDPSYHAVNNVKFRHTHMTFPHFTPLHGAVHLGEYDFARYLVHEYYGVKYVQNLDHLVHLCVCDTDLQTDSTIEEKLSILDMLTEINPDWLNEKNEYNCPPLLLQCVHVRLLKQLVHNGADINAIEASGPGTVLHSALEPGHTQQDILNLINWAFSNGFQLVNHTDGMKRTPLILAIEMVGNLDEEVLRIFYENGADFNAVNYRGDSVLFYALKFSGKTEFIRKLLEYGANVNHRNILRQNALHVLAEPHSSELVENKILTFGELAEDYPHLLAERDGYDRTPPQLRFNHDSRISLHVVEVVEHSGTPSTLFQHTTNPNFRLLHGTTRIQGVLRSPKKVLYQLCSSTQFTS